MHKKRFIPIIWVALLFGACTPITSDADQAQKVLIVFFDELAAGHFNAAAQLYGGSYETLMAYNPDVTPDNLSKLWQNACQINGLQCLTIRTITFNELTTSGEYIFTVEFNAPDGNLYVREACCGDKPSTPPQFQFEYRVTKSGDGKFRVLDMPVFVP